MNNRKYANILELFMVGVVISSGLVFAEDSSSAVNRKKRDPFVALVDSDGKIKSEEDLFPASEKRPLSMNLTLTAILWDEKRPLVMINNHVYSEGNVIGSLIIEKIYPNSIVVNDNGNLVTIDLRTIEKK